MTKILVTGGLGGIGAYLAERALEEGYKVKILDIENKRTKNRAKSPKLKDAEIVYGNIIDYGDCLKCIWDVDTVCHLAAILHPKTEEVPDLAKKVNIEGTANIVKAIQTLNPNIHLIFSSSVSVFGHTQDRTPPITIDDPVNPTDIYTETKVKCEEIIENSELKHWTILRFAEAAYLSIRMEDYNQMYMLPLDNRLEFVHVFDIVTACINAIRNEECYQKKFIIAGGKKNQMIWRDQLEILMKTLGMPIPPEEYFSKEPFYLDWYDTEESQRVLQFQERTFDDFVEDFKDLMGFRLGFVKYMFGPMLKVYRWGERMWKKFPKVTFKRRKKGPSEWKVEENK